MVAGCATGETEAKTAVSPGCSAPVSREGKGAGTRQRYISGMVLHWGQSWPVPSARRCTNTGFSLWGMCGLHHSAGQQVSHCCCWHASPLLDPWHIAWREALSPQGFVWEWLDVRLQHHYKQENDSKFSFLLEVLYSAMYYFQQKRWQVFIEFAWRSQFSLSAIKPD